MQVDIVEVNGIYVVRLRERRIDASRSAELRKLFQDLNAEGKSRLAMDFSGVEFMDSSGVGALVSGLKLMGNAGDMALFGVSGLVENLFRLTRMNRIFHIYENEEKAIESLAR